MSLYLKKECIILCVSVYGEAGLWHIGGKSVNHSAVLGRTTALAGILVPGPLKPPVGGEG